MMRRVVRFEDRLCELPALIGVPLLLAVLLAAASPVVVIVLIAGSSFGWVLPYAAVGALGWAAGRTRWRGAHGGKRSPATSGRPNGR